MVLTLILGAAGSGKTAWLIERAVERYAADPLAETLVLVPTVRHADQFRRRLVQRCGVGFGLQVATIAQWSRVLVDATVPTRGVVSALLEDVTADAIADGRAHHFRSLAGTPGLHSMITAAVADLLAEDIASASFLTATNGIAEDAGLPALAAILVAYENELLARGWLHPARLASTAAAALRAGASAPRCVLVDGFQRFRAGEQVLLTALAESTEVFVAFDGNASERAAEDLVALRTRLPTHLTVEARRSLALPRVTASSAATPEAQLRAIAREIKQLLIDHPSLRPSDCAVTFRQVTPYLALARQVFAEYDLPLDPAAGERLSTRPLGVWVRRLLHLSSDGWRLRDLIAVLSSGFLNGGPWALTRNDIARIARIGRTHHLWAGLEAMDRLADALLVFGARAGVSEDQRTWWRNSSNALRAALGVLNALLVPAVAPLRDHARRLEATLFGPYPLVSTSIREDPRSRSN